MRESDLLRNLSGGTVQLCLESPARIFVCVTAWPGAFDAERLELKEQRLDETETGEEECSLARARGRDERHHLPIGVRAFSIQPKKPAC